MVHQDTSRSTSANRTEDVPAPCIRALNESRVVVDAALDFSETHTAETSAILVPRTVALPGVDGADEATDYRFVVVLNGG